MTSEDVMIKIDSLTKSFGRIKALNDLNLEIGRGELLGIIGSNGAGKTTTIRIICCILKPDSGDVLVDGHSIQTDPIKIKSMDVDKALPLNDNKVSTITANVKGDPETVKSAVESQVDGTTALTKSDFTKQIDEMMSGLLLFIGAIASIGLIVGLISIVNIMDPATPTTGEGLTVIPSVSL